MMARLLADNFEKFNGMIISQRRRGALPKVVQGGGLRLVHVLPICKLSKTVPVSLCFADVRQIRTGICNRISFASFDRIFQLNWPDFTHHLWVRTPRILHYCIAMAVFRATCQVEVSSSAASDRRSITRVRGHASLKVRATQQPNPLQRIFSLQTLVMNHYLRIFNSGTF
jgi:hypothetical protein